jgi:hypothetical protein
MKPWCRSTLFMAACLIATGAFPVSAKVTCTDPDANSIRHCAAGTPQVVFLIKAYDEQHRTEWCWLASAAMIFRYYGVTVSQVDLADQFLGLPPGAPPPNVPAYSYDAIRRLLNHTWVDSAGNKFTTSAVEISKNDPVTLIKALGENPLYVVSPTHAMVLTGLSYYLNYMTNYAGVVGGHFMDPWPPGLDGYPGGSREFFTPEWNTLQHFWRVTVKQ